MSERKWKWGRRGLVISSKVQDYHSIVGEPLYYWSEDVVEWRSLAWLLVMLGWLGLLVFQVKLAWVS